METSVSCLINSISRFIHLVLCQTTVAIHLQPSYRKITEVLKLLKPVLDEVVEQKVSLQHGNQEVLYKHCEELDVAVNEAREFMESWSPKLSKICFVLESEPLIIKIQNLSLEICRIVCRLLPSSPSSSSLAQIEELQYLRQERAVKHIEDALRNQRDGILPASDTVSKIIELLNVRSGQELLKESLAIEKERMNAEILEARERLDEIDQIVGLVAHLRDSILRTDIFEIKSGVPVPPYFRCPLSLELMLDPVIVASGQTYERASIQKWLDHGLNICPITRQLLTHKNLIPNYTVKAMVENWCEQNRIKLSNIGEGHNPVPAPVLKPSGVSSPIVSADADSFQHAALSSNHISRSSGELGKKSDNGKVEVSCKSTGEEYTGQGSETENYDSLSLERMSIHSRSESANSAISNVDYGSQISYELLRRSMKPENAPVLSDAVAPSTVASQKGSVFYPVVPRNQLIGSKAKMAAVENGPTSEFDDLTTKYHVKELVEDLQSQSTESQTAAAAELRLLGKHNKENRILIGQCGAISPLLSLLYSEAEETQEHAVTALLNLSICEENKAMIAEAGAIEPLVHVLKSGSEGAQENSAAALFSLSNLEDYKAKIGRSGAVKALVNLLGSGTLRGKKDAATALFNLSIFHENKSRIVQAGAVKYLVELMDPDSGMVDKAVALLSNLSTIIEGRAAIAKEGGIPLLVEVIESGSHRGKENAASVILQMCLNSPKFCTLVLQEGVVPPLVALSQSGTPRAREKAQQLLSHFRNQREVALVKGKS